jgi:AAA family ATP:ADP antiporter
MHLMDRLSAFFNIQPGEGRLVTLLTLQYFFLGAAFVFTQTTAFALFLTEFGAQYLPLVYIAIAVGASLAAYIYLKLGEHLALSKLLKANLASLTVISLGLRLGLLLPQAHWVIFILPVWFQILANFEILAIWTMAGRLLDVRQGKRLFGLIGAGNWLAIAAGGFIVSPIVAALGTQNLLVLAAISLAAGIVVQLITLREYGKPLEALSAPDPATVEKPRDTGILRSRYVILFIMLVIVWWVGLYFVDNIFYDRAVLQFPDPNQLASTLGNLFAAIGVLGLIITTFFTGPVLNRFGLKTGLLVLPVILVASIGGLAIGGVLGLTATALFAFAALAKITDISFGFTLDLSAHNLLFQPLPASQRANVQTLADGIVQPLAIGLAGLLLLLFNTILGFRAIQLSFVFLVIAAIWIIIVIALQHEYPAALRRALEKRRLGASLNAFVDQAYGNVLRQSLASPHPAVVIYSLNLLQQSDPTALTYILPNLLKHSSPEVRQTALEHIEQFGLTRELPAVRQHLTEETNSQVRNAAIYALAALGGAGTIEDVLPYLDNSDEENRRAAIIGLLRSAGIEGTLYAGQILLRMTTSSVATERELAAQVLGEVGIHQYYQPLVELLCDDDVTVRRAALRAAGQIRHPRLWPLVLEALCIPQTRSVAMAALVSGSEGALPEIRSAFTRDDADATMRMYLAQICGRIAGETTIELLKVHINEHNPDTRSEVLKALSRCGYHALDGEAGNIQNQITAEVKQASWLLACSLDVSKDGEASILQAALAGELRRLRERIFLLLSFIFDSNTILQVSDSLSHGTSEQQAYALEILEIVLPDELKRTTLVLASDLTLESQYERLNALFPQKRLNFAERLVDLSGEWQEGVTAWTQACARYVQHSVSFTTDGDRDMFSTIEKVIALKTTGVFAEIPDRILAEVAELCEEVQISEGATVFQKGELGKSLYVIVAGRVRVHDEDQTFEFLNGGQVFGEMALLDPEPRSASITAMEDTQLMRLDQEPFYELLEEQGELARGMIKLLTRRLRARMQDLNELRLRMGGETIA